MSGRTAGKQPGLQVEAVVVAGLLFAAAIAASLALGFRSGVQFNPQPGIGAFAIFYLIAALVERVLEPFSGLLIFARTSDEQGATSTTRKTDLTESSDKTQASTNGTIVMWAAATLLSTVACWYFGLSLFRAVGVTAGVADWVALFVTALIIGSGTKPLHDVISNLQAPATTKAS
jgi:hypothetical protein